VPSISPQAIRPAAILAAVLLLITAAFQVWWALGGSWGLGGAWGGEYTVLPDSLRLSSGISAIVLVFAVVIVLERAGYGLLNLRHEVLRRGIWVVVAVNGVSALANFASSSDWERYMNGPVALIVAILCLAVARSDMRYLPNIDE
jgi:hypothetical protein